MSDRSRRSLWPFVWVVLAFTGLVTLLVMNATAREVAIETSKTIFGIVTTPFIFEATLGISGVFIVMAINHWRIKREGDGWVYMVTHEPEEGAESLPPALTQRLQGVILTTKPEVLDEVGTSRLMIEGFLEMGMAAQAHKEFGDLDELPDDAPSSALRIRVAAANLATEDALACLRESSSRFPREENLWSQTAGECADWLKAHAPQQHETIALWQREAGRAVA